MWCRWWWLGLNDIAVEGEFVWPVSGPATFTYWDVEYEEPYPGKLAAQSVTVRDDDATLCRS